MSNSNGAIDWDDEVSSADAGDNAQSDDIVVLPDGTYPCKVMKVERGSTVVEPLFSYRENHGGWL